MSDPDLEIRFVSKKFFASPPDLNFGLKIRGEWWGRGGRGGKGGRAGASPGSATDVGR